MYKPDDFYFQQAKKYGYRARSVFKLEQIQNKFHIFDLTTRIVLDIGCAPGSRLQYTQSTLQHIHKDQTSYKILGFDIQAVCITLPSVYVYRVDVTDRFAVQEILSMHAISIVDCIISDMAPYTIGLKDIDAIRLFDRLQQRFWLIKDFLRPNGTLVVKVFMGPGFQEYMQQLKSLFGGKAIKIYKPPASRLHSKEIYVIKK